MLVGTKRLITKAGLGGDYLLYEDFSRYPNSTVMSGKIPRIGPTWGTTGASLPTITNGKLTNTNLGYLYANLRGIPQVLGAKISFSGGTNMTQQPFAMSFSSQPPGALIIQNLVHYNLGPTGFTSGWFDGSGNFTAIQNGVWKTAMRNDGTIYETFFGVTGDTFIVVGPNKEVFQCGDPNIPAQLGPMAFWEPITEADGLACQVAVAYAANNRLPPYMTDSLNPSSATTSNTVTLSNNNLTATASSASGSPQSLGSKTRVAGKVYFEFTKNLNSAANDQGLGIASQLSHSLSTQFGTDNDSMMVTFYNNNIFAIIGGVYTQYGGTWTWPSGSKGACAIDFAAKKMWIMQLSPTPSGWLNDVIANQNPATGVGGIDISGVTSRNPPFLAGICFGQAVVNDQFTLNMGASSFGGTVPSGFEPW